MPTRIPARLTGSLLPLARKWRRAVDIALTPFTLSESFGGPLIYLGRSGGGISQSELAELSGIGGPSLVRIVDRLVANRLVERQIDADDKRLRRLFLTARGAALATQMEQALDGLRAKVLDGIAPADIATAVTVIDRMNAVISKLATADDTPAATAP